MLKIRCTDVRHPTPEYSHLTENQKAKFHSPYITNEERNLVWHNSVNKIPSNLVTQTKSSTASVSDSVFSEGKEEITEDVPAEDEPAPAPAPTLETVKEQPHTPGTRKSTRKNFRKPASAYSDFYMQDAISTWISGYPLQCWTLRKVVNRLLDLVQCHIYIET